MHGGLLRMHRVVPISPHLDGHPFYFLWRTQDFLCRLEKADFELLFAILIPLFILPNFLAYLGCYANLPNNLMHIGALYYFAFFATNRTKFITVNNFDKLWGLIVRSQENINSTTILILKKSNRNSERSLEFIAPRDTNNILLKSLNLHSGTQWEIAFYSILS